ncbi:hypothetical protein M422DRAFT_34667 [Sphaerobolus stellatus SS14]|uniref:Uncharacterized protein n=1 Tax=Sphaerobolus stellatus (strain SS14) TaxID=990650 RepID=A0A0C9VD25_SPHS4|nr:hypothetical protein M422DRAFT_34667 [Sphaerobolus stellatus SS14]
MTATTNTNTTTMTTYHSSGTRTDSGSNTGVGSGGIGGGEEDLEAAKKMVATLRKHDGGECTAGEGGEGVKLSKKQVIYIFGMQGIRAGLLDAAMNFGIACAMY